MPYQICIEGHVDARWAVLFPGMTLAHQFLGALPVTMLCGMVSDQPALYGILNQLRDLGATLVALARVNAANMGCLRFDDNAQLH